MAWYSAKRTAGTTLPLRYFYEDISDGTMFIFPIRYHVHAFPERSVGKEEMLQFFLK
jgi:hypothetical protein